MKLINQYQSDFSDRFEGVIDSSSGPFGQVVEPAASTEPSGWEDLERCIREVDKIY